MFPLLRANRLYAIFNTGLKKMASSCPRYSSSSFTRSTWLWFCPLQTLSNNWLFLFPTSADGKESSLPFLGPNQSFGFSLLPPGQTIFLGLLDVTQVPFFFHQVTKYKHLFLTVILWWLATVNLNTRIVLILFLSSQRETTRQNVLAITLVQHFFLFLKIVLGHLINPFKFK